VGDSPRTVRVFLSVLLGLSKHSQLSSFPGEVTLSVAYGYEVEGRDDRLLNVSMEGVQLSARVGPPGALLVNDIPFRR
jgi:hypothetical protein